ncbi:Brain-specific angiogenesis inhibitor 1-associated protein 2, partial [Araneus ventricosus]
TALMQLVEVHKEIHAQQTNILKAFYVDLLLPLESNLEKDTKVVAGEHKRFLQQHKSHHDSYQKALSMCKKQKKRTRSSLFTIGKDVKQLHAMEDEKKKLDGFCDQSLKQAITQERRRYGFVLERQCSLAKHYLAYHTKVSA